MLALTVKLKNIYIPFHLQLSSRHLKVLDQNRLVFGTLAWYEGLVVMLFLFLKQIPAGLKLMHIIHSAH